jgi:hypothetical protein
MKTFFALCDMVPFLAATSHRFIEISALAIDAMALALILSTFVWASIRFLVHTDGMPINPYERYKLVFGKIPSARVRVSCCGARDPHRSSPPTFANIGILVATILTRTFLSWSLIVEMEGRWPWRPAAIRSPEVSD